MVEIPFMQPPESANWNFVFELNLSDFWHTETITTTFYTSVLLSDKDREMIIIRVKKENERLN